MKRNCIIYHPAGILRCTEAVIRFFRVGRDVHGKEFARELLEHLIATEGEPHLIQKQETFIVIDEAEGEKHWVEKQMNGHGLPKEDNYFTGDDPYKKIADRLLNTVKENDEHKRDMEKENLLNSERYKDLQS